MSTAGEAPAIVYVVDDDLSVRESLSSLIRSAGMSVEVFESARAFLGSARTDVCGCLILDLRMPEIDGFGLQQMLTHERREIPVIFVTGHGDVPLAVRAMKAGAVEFLNKPFNDDELIAAVIQALARSQALCQERATLEDLRARLHSLTAREHEVLAEVVKGLANKNVAAKLGVCESTVKVHRHNIMLKMRMNSLPELALALQLVRDKAR